jgi:hypothetical protein
MKKNNLYQWLIVFTVAACTFTACAKNNNAFKSNLTANNKVEIIETDSIFIPPSVITVPDDKVKTNKEDELYYDDENGYRYWKNNDGKFYLDPKYLKQSGNKKKIYTAKFANS